MNVRITVSGGGKPPLKGMSHTISLSDVISIEQVSEALNKEFKGFFPPQSKLTDEKPKGGKK